MKQTLHTKKKILSKILVSLGMVFVLASAITQVHSEVEKVPIITISNTADGVMRGKIGSFVLSMNTILLGERYVNFSVKGTALPGVDYVPPVSPAHIGKSGYGVILLQSLRDRRGSTSPQSYSVVVTLEPGPGYAVGEPNSAKMMIEPLP